MPGGASFSRARPPQRSGRIQSSRGAERVMSTHGFSGSGRLRSSWLTPWLKATFSVLGSAVAMFAVGAFCALTYPILRELRAERLRGENGTEERMLGFWSILMISAVAGCISCIFSWTLTQLESYQPGMAFPSLLSLLDFRDPSSHRFNMNSGLAVLNGILAMLTVIWSLS
ncbi:PREDICTED: ADP-ribosylation factor-like protein 6-interacting protein 6 [Poecilia mexicana]|uniref:ADP-ribosylation factor-like 6 interacting protein 6 n=1 Tax=Poecilia mexicana TaxID=48701 RepID=A0A3B3Y4B9_9TELE|nr:PREDICTED: ADP-ribosylation factor-like protein 6-interacting protein 6 [Poecilia mexicana]